MAMAGPRFLSRPWLAVSEQLGLLWKGDYRNRHKIESSFARLKDWQRGATRYDRCPKVCLSACALATLVMFWL